MPSDMNDSDIANITSLENDFPSNYSRPELKALMSSYGQNNEDYQQQYRRYSVLLNQSLIALALASLLAANSAWPALTIIMALLATWRLSQCFAIDHQCEVLETTHSQAKTELEYALTTTDGKSMLAGLYQEFDQDNFQGHLAYYLPGPLEVNRQSTQFQFTKLIID